MTSIHDAGVSAQVGQLTSHSAEGMFVGDQSGRLFELLPFSDQLAAVASGAGVAGSPPVSRGAGQHAVTFEVLQALLGPLESLPPFIALDTVRRRAGAAQTTGTNGATTD